MTKTIAIAIRPNQVKFAEALASGPYPDCEILFCHDTPEQFASQFKGDQITSMPSLPDNLDQNGTDSIFQTIDRIREIAGNNPVTLLIPHAPDPALFHFMHLAYESGLNIQGLQKFYEGLGSYTTNEETFAQKNQAFFSRIAVNDPRRSMDFIGIREMDQVFARTTAYQGVGADRIFPKVDPTEIPEILKQASSLFLGQPLFEGTGNLDTPQTFAAFAHNLQANGVDLYIPHPRETAYQDNLPEGLNVLALSRPIEEYRDALKGKTVTTLFSSSVFTLASEGAHIKIAEAVPPAPWRDLQPIEDAYRPLKALFPVIEISRISQGTAPTAALGLKPV
jgi:hypothetical protein